MKEIIAENVPLVTVSETDSCLNIILNPPYLEVDVNSSNPPIEVREVYICCLCISAYVPILSLF